MKVYIDNILVQYPNASLLEPKFTFRRKNEDGQLAISFTGDLTFTGADYTYIYNKLVLAPNAINDSITLTFVDDCCNNTQYLFLIKPESLKWCDNSCEITANAVEYTPDSKAYNCFESTLIWDDWNGFKSASHPRMKYCLEYRPSILQDFALIIGVATLSMIGAFIPVLATIATIVGTINTIINVLNTLPGVNLSTIGGLGGTGSVLQWMFNTYNSFGSIVAGCGYEHPSPLVRDYINNVCNKCGIAFSSSILNETNPSMPNNEYYNLVYFSAPIKSGRINLPYFVKPLVPFIEDNQPIHNGKSLMDELKQPFNAEWDISNGVVRFERRDFFQNQIPWFDATTYDSSKIISQCYEWSSKRRPAYADIQYQKDAVDWCGSEAWARWSDIVEWNSPPNPVQKGAFTKMFPYSPARFRDDGIERDVLGDYNWLPFGVGASIIANNNAMIMNSGTSFTPKLLIWDTSTSNVNDARVISYNKGGVAKAFNYPMWVDANYSGNLYDRFWAIENPNNSSFSGFDFTIELIFDCTTLNALNISGTVLTSKGLSKTIDSIDVDFSSGTMTIKGTI